MIPDALATALRDAALVVVQAPAGFGKTTSVRAALSDAADVAWYDAQPWEAGAFVPALLACVRAVRPDAGRLTLSLAEQRAAPERLGATLADELGHVEAPLRIVVDDAHVLGAPFAAFARILTTRMPEPVRVVLLTRAPLDVGVPEAVAAGRGVLINAAALQFDASRARALARSLGVTLDDAGADALVARTGGWPIAVALALRAPASSDALLGDLVARHVDALTPEDRALLDATVAYETIEPSVAAPGDAEFVRRLRALASEGILLGAVRGGFRVHPLVRDVLAQAAGDDALAARHAAAAAAYTAAGRLRPALFHLDGAHDVRADAAFLREHARDATASGLIDGLRAALARVGAAGDEPALVALGEGLLAKVRGDDGRDAFAAAAREADARGDRVVAFEARLQSVESDLARGTTVTRERIDDLLERARERGRAALDAASVRAGWADVVGGAFVHALARLDALEWTRDPAGAADVVPLAAYAHVALGDFEASEHAMSTLLERLATGDDVARYASALIWAARFALLRGELTAAYELAREGERIARPFAVRSHDAALHGTLAEAALHVGDTGTARRSARAALRSADAAWYVRDVERTRAVAARVLARADALDGDLAAARAASAGDDAPSLADAALFATLAGAPDAAALRGRARMTLEATAPVDGADAVALWSAARTLDALDAAEDRPVTTALRSAPFEGLVARRASSPVTEPGFEARVLARLAPRAHGGGAPARSTDLIEPLTSREAEILELLAAGLTNREIAQRLILSARTVETHVARITGKLGVNSRARAVARAVALGLVVPAADAL